MKTKILSLFLAILLAGSLFACGRDVLTVGSFSYEEVTAAYRAGEPGVLHEGFVNKAECPVDDEYEALELAKEECNIKYDATSVSYDGTAKMWQVSFWTEGADGGCIDVFLDERGITRMIVMGK